MDTRRLTTRARSVKGGLTCSEHFNPIGWKSVYLKRVPVMVPPASPSPVPVDVVEGRVQEPVIVVWTEQDAGPGSLWVSSSRGLPVRPFSAALHSTPAVCAPSDGCPHSPVPGLAFCHRR